MDIGCFGERECKGNEKQMYPSPRLTASVQLDLAHVPLTSNQASDVAQQNTQQDMKTDSCFNLSRCAFRAYRNVSDKICENLKPSGKIAK